MKESGTNPVPRGAFLYYVKTDDDDGKPKMNKRVHKKTGACVCFSENDDGTIARGVSICSDNDNFSKSIGRNIAIGRHTKAVAEGDGSGEMVTNRFGQDPVKSVVNFVHHDGSNIFLSSKFKCAYGVQPTKFEASIIVASKRTSMNEVTAEVKG